MVEFEKEDRISLIKRLIEEQKKEEERIKAEEEELLKKAEEIKKKKEDADKKKDDVNSALEKALDEESKDLRRSESFRRTDVDLQTSRREEVASSSSDVKEKDEENDSFEEVKKDSNPEILYRRMPQSPTVSDVYRQLETIYKQIPDNNSQTSARQAQREIYHELKAMANHWGTQKPRLESPSESSKGYGKEIEVNPHSEASTWDRLTDRVKAMAQNAGPDEHHYRQRTEIVLNELRRNFEEREYKLQDKKDEFR